MSRRAKNETTGAMAALLAMCALGRHNRMAAHFYDAPRELTYHANDDAPPQRYFAMERKRKRHRPKRRAW